MVCLRSPDVTDIFARAQHGLLDLVAISFRLRQHWNRHQYNRHYPVHALPGNDPGEDAAVGLAEPDDGGAGDPRRKSTYCCSTNVADRPLLGRTFLRYAGWRL